MLIGFKKKAAPHMLTKACAKNASPFQQSCPGASNCEIKITRIRSLIFTFLLYNYYIDMLAVYSLPKCNFNQRIWATQLAPRTWKPWNPETLKPHPRRFPNHQAAHGSAPRPRSFGSWKLSVSLTSSMWRWSYKITRKVGHCLFLLPFCCSAVIFG